MRTRKIKLYYQLTPSKIFTPSPEAMARKDAWVKDIQRTIPADKDFKTIEVQYRLFDPHVEQQRKFFNGPCIDYWVIQSQQILSGSISRLMHNQARETLLSSVLGYNVRLINRVERRRKSTADFTETQEWNDFLETLRETEFEPQGYEIPDSEVFWELQKKYGYERACGMSIEQLRERLIKRLSTHET